MAGIAVRRALGARKLSDGAPPIHPAIMIRRVFCLVAWFLAGVSTSAAQDLATPEQVLAKLTLVNDRFLKNWPDPAPDIVTDRARPITFGRARRTSKA